MIYTTKDGVRIDCDFDKKEKVRFKVNLPLTEEDFNSDNGEGVWCECGESEFNEIDSHNSYIVAVKILNDSVYYPNLKYGDIVLAKFTNSKHRPIALRDELIHNYGQPISLEEKNNIINEILKFHGAKF